MTEQKIDVLVEAVRKVVSDLEQRNAELQEENKKLRTFRDNGADDETIAKLIEYRDYSIELRKECDRLRRELDYYKGE